MAKVAVHLSSGIAVSIPIERNIENGLLNLDRDDYNTQDAICAVIDAIRQGVALCDQHGNRVLIVRGSELAYIGVA